MNTMKASLLAGALAVTGFSMTQAATVDVSTDITTSTVWTADNVYRLTDQIYVQPGASLTIEAGTVIASEAGVGGSLAVTRGAQIFVNGTADDPVIMTSDADVATWDVDATHPTGKDPKTGTWRPAVNEWGNLTIMGDGVLSGSDFDGNPVTITQDDDGVAGGSTTTRQNTAIPDGLNQRVMEGLTAEFTGDPRILYGGDNDNDDSGTINYLSIRYCGKVIGLGNELNGFSLGAIGRETDISHVDIMNNVDDGIEIWGGTVNLKYVNIWNIGDDSFDIDQGWRGKAQFGLIVQGYGTNASQGSGIGDNIFETDGAEDSDAQPVTTGVIYNFTAVGQPLDGDGGTTWRDNARMQYRNCIFMNVGDELVKFDDDDGDGANGYSGPGASDVRDNTPSDGTLNWEDHWTTAWNNYPTVNAAPGAVPADFNSSTTLYQSQVDGFICEISDSVFYENAAGAYSESDLLGVTVAGDDAPTFNNVVADNSPITSITRDSVESLSGKNMVRVLDIDPLPQNDAVTSVSSAPNDGFFTPANYRGAFAPASTRRAGENWLVGWTAADAFGFVTDSSSGGANVENWKSFD